MKGGAALLAVKFLAPPDLEMVGVEEPLREATNAQILAELNHRVDPEARRLFRGEGQDVIDIADDDTFDEATPGVQPPWQDFAVADESPDHEEEDTDYN